MNSAKLALRQWHGWLLALGAGACLLPSLHAATTGCYSAPAGLAGWWPGDGNANDIAGANSGTLLGGATASGVGTVASAFSFDGTNGYVQIPDSASLRPTNLTVEAWVRFNTLDTPGNAQAGQQYIVFKQNTRSSFFEGYYLGKVRHGGADVLTFITASASAPAADQMAILESTTLVTPGVWYHVAGVRGPNYAELYVNGQLESRTNANFTQDYGNFPLYFGTSGQSFWDRKFSGLLDEVSLYNRALSSNEVAAIYAAGGKCKAPGITTDPASQAVLAGSNVLFTVTATGFGTLGYQWRFNGTAISGRTDASLTLTNVQTTNTGSYTAVVTNSLGAATSGVATLTVWVPPVISGQPQSRTNILGTDADFSVTASGTPNPAYQWEFNGAAISGATGSALLRSAVGFGNAGDYRVVLTNMAGAVTSDVAKLTVICPAVTVSPPALPSTLLGAAYSQSLSAGGGNGPYSFALTAGSLPAGLDLSTAGALTGAPTAVGTTAFTVTATDTNGCSGSRPYSLAVTGAPPVISLQPLSRTNIVRTDASFSVTASGTPPPSCQWEFNGTAIAGATGSTLLRASVSFADAGNYRVVLTNVAGTRTSDVATLTVICPLVIVDPTNLPASLLDSPYSQSITASGGNGPYGFSVTTGALPAGLNLSGTGTLAGAPSAIGTNSFTVTATDTNGCFGSRAYSLAITGAPPLITLQPQSRTNAVATDASFSVTATGAPLPAYQWEFNGAAIPGATGSGLLRSAARFADAGSYRVVVTNVAGRATSDVATLTVVCPSVSTSPSQLPNGSLDSPYTQSLSGVGGNGPYAFAVTTGALPPGLQLSGTGAFSGTPSAIGTNSFTVTATDTNGCAGSRAYSVAVPGAPPLIMLQPQSRTNIVGTDASFSATASGTPPPVYQWQFGGAAIPGATGSALLRSAVSFAQAGDYRCVASNAAGVVTSDVATLTVICPSMTVSPATLTNGLVFSPYSQVLTASGGNGASSFAVTAGLLPAGLNLSSTGLLDGTPSGVGTSSFTVTATDTNGCLGSRAYSLTVTGMPPFITLQPQNLTREPGTVATISVTATGTVPLTYQWARDGFSLTDNGHITGATADTLQITGLLTDDAGDYTVTISNVAGVVTSAMANLTVTLPMTCVPPVAGLVGWWPGDGNANDLAGTNNGTLQAGAGASAVGMVGSAFSLDGTNASVRIPDSPALRPTNLTIETWVWFNSLDTPTSGNSPVGEQYLVFKESTHPQAFEGYALTKARVDSRDVFDIAVSSAAGQTAELTSQTLVVTGAWYHVAAVRGSNYLQLYVNGQLEGQTNVSFPQDYGNYPLLFGSSGQPTWDHKLAGRLDEVSLYNRALSSNEIAAVYAARADGKCKAVAITAQPQSKTVGLGSNVTFSVTASGSGPLMYRWQRAGVDLSNGGNLSGAFAPTLGIANASTNDAGSYRVVVTNMLGTATSAVAVLTVVPSLDPPRITAQPASQTAAAGTNVTFSVNVSGTAPFGFQWRFNGANLAPSAQTDSVTGPTLAINYVLPANSGGYSVVVTNGAGAVTSDVATLTIGVPNGCLPPPAGLVGWWPGDGSTKDIVGTNNGILMGNGVADAPGFTGQAFSFDGTNGYVQIPDSPTFHPTNLTVECWVRFAAYQTPGDTYYSNQQYIVFKQNSRHDEFEGFALTKDHDPQGDVFLWEVASASGELIRVDTISTVVTGVWYHVVGVRGTNYVQLYKDGLLEVQASVNFPQDYGNNPLYFGTSGQSYYDRRLHAELDEVALYDRALSADEIATLYAAGAAGKCKGTNGVSITLQPRSEAVVPGSSITLSAAATGLAPLGFQWQLNGAAIVGATATSLTFTNVQPTNAGNYRVVVSNPAGSVISDTATLSIGSPPVLLDPRTSGNGTFSFTVTGTSGQPYVIEFSTNFHDWTGLTSVTAIAGQAVFTDTIPPNSAARFYRARLSY